MVVTILLVLQGIFRLFDELKESLIATFLYQQVLILRRLLSICHIRRKETK